MNPADIRLLRAQITDSANREAEWISVPIHRLESLLDALDPRSGEQRGDYVMQAHVAGAFRCSGCGEHDAEIAGMCAREKCPREHEGYTEVRWFKPYDGTTKTHQEF